MTVDQSPITVGALTFDSANNYTIAASGSNNFSFQGSAGATTITITAQTGAHTISAPITLMNPLTINQGQAAGNNFTISGVMSGSTSVTVLGTGTVNLGAANTYNGGTIVGTAAASSGTLSCNVASALPPAGALTINAGGTVNCTIPNTLPSSGTVTANGPLNLNGNNQNIGPLAGSGVITLGGAALTTTTSATTTFSGQIANDPGSFTLAGTGTLIFSGQGFYQGGTTINGGTLQLQTNDGLPANSIAVNSGGTLNIGGLQTFNAISGSGNIILAATGANLTFNLSANSTFAGVVSGPGNLIKDGAATLILSGQNTFTGFLTMALNAGPVQLTANNGLSSSCVVFGNNGSTFDISPTTTQTIGVLTGGPNVLLGAAQLTINNTQGTSIYGGTGVISGTGSVVIAGTQNNIFTSQNTYTGGTTVTGFLTSGINNALVPTGSLTVSSPGVFNLGGFNQTVGALSGNGSIVTPGALTVNPSGASLFSGVISGSGSLTVGSVPVTGTLTLTGSNNYTGGTTVSNGATLQGTTTSLQGNIANTANLIFNQSFAGAYAGSLSGAGSLTITGGGSVTLLGANTQANTAVTGGTLLIGGGTLTSPVTVSSGAALGGTGTITGTVTNNGTLQLDLGTLNISGNYSQGAGSAFDVTVAAGSSGTLPVTGTVAITSPASMFVTVQPGPFAPSSLLTLITSGAPVTGTFISPTFSNPFFGGNLIYNGIAPGSVQLQLNILPLGNVIKGGNAGAIASCINLQAFPAESDLIPIVQDLIFLPLNKVKDALDEMQPSQLKSLSLAEEHNLVLVRSAISQRSDDFFRTNCNQAISDKYNWSLWTNISGNYLNQHHHTQNLGFQTLTGTGTLGIDTCLYDNIFFGLAGAYNYTIFDWERGRGKGFISSYYAGPYFSFFVDRHAALNFSVTGTKSSIHAKRHISFPGVDRHAESEHDGYGGIAHLDLDIYTYPATDVTLAPFAGVDYIYLHEPGFTEKNAGGLNLHIHHSTNILVRSELGAKIAKCATHDSFKFTHDLKLSWVYQHLIKGRHLSAQFPDVDCVFKVRGMVPERNFFDIAAGLTGIFVNDMLAFSLRYEGKFGESVVDNTGYFQFLLRF